MYFSSALTRCWASLFLSYRQGDTRLPLLWTRAFFRTSSRQVRWLLIPRRSSLTWLIATSGTNWSNIRSFLFPLLLVMGSRSWFCFITTFFVFSILTFINRINWRIFCTLISLHLRLFCWNLGQRWFVIVTNRALARISTRYSELEALAVTLAASWSLARASLAMLKFVLCPFKLLLEGHRVTLQNICFGSFDQIFLTL